MMDHQRNCNIPGTWYTCFTFIQFPHNSQKFWINNYIHIFHFFRSCPDFQCFFSRMRSEGFSFYIWGLARVRVTLLLPSATVRNRLQPFAHVRNRPSAAIVASKLPCLWEKSQKCVFFDVSQDVLMSFCVAGAALCDISLVWGARLSWGWSCHAYGKSRKSVSFSTCHKMCSCRFAWQAWHFFVTFQHASRRVKRHFVWQAQYFCHVFTRCVAFFVAGAALWRPPMSFCVAGVAL